MLWVFLITPLKGAEKHHSLSESDYRILDHLATKRICSFFFSSVLSKDVFYVHQDDGEPKLDDICTSSDLFRHFSYYGILPLTGALSSIPTDCRFLYFYFPSLGSCVCFFSFDLSLPFPLPPPSLQSL